MRKHADPPRASWNYILNFLSLGDFLQNTFELLRLMDTAVLRRPRDNGYHSVTIDIGRHPTTCPHKINHRLEKSPAASPFPLQRGCLGLSPGGAEITSQIHARDLFR